MHLLLIADTFPPLNNSGAVQLWDLALQFKEAGHQLTVVVASPQIKYPWVVESVQGIRVLRVKTQKLKDVPYIRRGLGELIMPFKMMRCLKSLSLDRFCWDGILWYSPSIFFGPLIHHLKKKNDCRTYLIIRDIFPEWAFDMGLIKNGPLYYLLKKIAKYQYALADTIGIQTPGNEKYFLEWKSGKNRHLEVLHNWITPSANQGCSIRLSHSPLAGRFFFVYAGNLGIAQNVNVFLDLAILLKDRTDIGFLFVGRGSELTSLKDKAFTNKLNNVLFADELDSREIPGLYAQCHAGMIALDQRHQSHNIPGKFLTYLSAGLPVLAQVNLNNDLVKIIESHKIGQVNLSYSTSELLQKSLELVNQVRSDNGMPERCREVSRKLFSTQAAAKQITAALTR